MEFYISGQRKVNLMFREAKGLFWYDRYKPLFESVINLTTSLLLVQKFGVAGILGGTVISSVCTCVWVEPYILMRYGIRDEWQKKLRDYFVRYAQRAAMVTALAAVSYGWVKFCPAKISSGSCWTASSTLCCSRWSWCCSAGRRRPSPSLRAERWLS